MTLYCTKDAMDSTVPLFLRLKLGLLMEDFCLFVFKRNTVFRPCFVDLVLQIYRRLIFKMLIYE